MIQPNIQSSAHQNSCLVQQILESVHIEGHLRDLACELTVKQDFINPSDTPIEAVYTFPLPYGAVLLDLTAKIGQRTLRGAVFAKQQAERRYEEAITEGDGAIMLEQSDDGICTVNLGNLMPGERATLTYQSATSSAGHSSTDGEPLWS
jgi:Ca-activated chloride channel family protein